MEEILGSSDLSKRQNLKSCKVSNIWQTLGKRWALQILTNLSSKEATRFNELQRLLPGISNSVLAERLEDLERESLIVRKIYPEVPPKVEYSLTEQARELEKILYTLDDWVEKWNTKKEKIAAKLKITKKK